MINAIIFDFFGVIGKSTRRMMREHFNLTDQQYAELQNLHKMLDYEYIGSRGYLEAFAKIVGSTYDEVYKIYEDSKSRFQHSQDILDYIAELHKKYKTALLSNVSPQAYGEFIKPVIGYFDVVVTSYVTKYVKPDVRAYQFTAQQLGVDVSECLMVDDSHTNCEGARAAGMEAIEFTDLENLKQKLKEFTQSE